MANQTATAIMIPMSTRMRLTRGIPGPSEPWIIRPARLAWRLKPSAREGFKRMASCPAGLTIIRQRFVKKNSRDVSLAELAEEERSENLHVQSGRSFRYPQFAVCQVSSYFLRPAAQVMALYTRVR